MVNILLSVIVIGSEMYMYIQVFSVLWWFDIKSSVEQGQTCVMLDVNDMTLVL